MKKSGLSIFVATMIIGASEFLRNTYLVHQQWIDHYQELGTTFPEKPINGMVWGLWSLSFAVLIFVLSKKYSLKQTIMLSWCIGFPLMWIVIGNMGVLPYSILSYAIPLSVLEVSLASLTIHKLSRANM